MLTEQVSILWGEEILRAGHELRLPGTGSSMLPAIHPDSTLIIRPATGAEVRIGDIVVYRSGSELVAHRLVEKQWQAGGLVLRTKGDTHRRFDPPLPADQVLGRVVATQRRGRPKRFDGPVGRMLGVLCARLLPAAPWLMPLYLRIRRKLGAVARRVIHS
ncbi:MAG: S24 family peptidase [Planctomycetota bacterium]